jgi:hypothetical protein
LKPWPKSPKRHEIDRRHSQYRALKLLKAAAREDQRRAANSIPANPAINKGLLSELAWPVKTLGDADVLLGMTDMLAILVLELGAAAIVVVEIGLLELQTCQAVVELSGETGSEGIVLVGEGACHELQMLDATGLTIGTLLGAIQVFHSLLEVWLVTGKTATVDVHGSHELDWISLTTDELGAGWTHDFQALEDAGLAMGVVETVVVVPWRLLERVETKRWTRNRSQCNFNKK